MNASKSKWKNERISLSHTQYCAFAGKFVCNIMTKGFDGWRKIDELLSWDLQTTS